VHLLFGDEIKLSYTLALIARMLQCTQLARVLKGTAACEQSELKRSSTLFHHQTASAQIAIGLTDTRKNNSLNTNGPVASAQQKEKGNLDNNSEASQSHANT